MAKKVKVVIIGYGDRGSIYANYASTHKDEAEIVAVVDMLEYRLKEASEKFGIPKQNLFTSIEDFINAKIECDLVVNAIMDQMHYETAIVLIDNGYNVLLEKPVPAVKEELLEVDECLKANSKNLAEELGDLLFAIVSLARLSGLESEEILNLSTEKFIQRFKKTENLILNDGKNMKELSPKEIDDYYNAVKRN